MSTTFHCADAVTNMVKDYIIKLAPPSGIA